MMQLKRIHIITVPVAVMLLASSVPVFAGQTLNSTGNGQPASNLQGPAGFGDTSGAPSNATSIGDGSTASGVSSSAYGSQSTASGPGSSAYGVFSNASGDEASAYGFGSEASNQFSSAFGFSSSASTALSSAYGAASHASAFASSAYGAVSTASGTSSSAYGYESCACGDGSVAIGNNATVNTGATGSVAIGQNSSVSANTSNAVALGSGSVANQSNTVSVGAPGAERRITNVAAGVKPTDAVNVSQLQGFVVQNNRVILGQANAYTDQQVAAGVQSADNFTNLKFTQSINYTNAVASQMQQQWNSRMTRIERSASQGVAAVAAMLTAMRTPDPGKTTISLGGGYYGGQAATALTMAHRNRSGRLQAVAAIGIPVSMVSGQNIAAAGAIGWQF